MIEIQCYSSYEVNEGPASFRLNHKTYQVAVSRNGRLVGEWYQGTDPDESHRQASAAKSYYSSMLGVAVADGKIGSPDDKVVDHHPELIEEKIRNPIRGTWGYEYSNFKLQPEARLNIFGYSTQDLFHC